MLALDAASHRRVTINSQDLNEDRKFSLFLLIRTARKFGYSGLAARDRLDAYRGQGDSASARHSRSNVRCPLKFRRTHRCRIRLGLVSSVAQHELDRALLLSQGQLL